jgi:hypothetical protein
MQRLRNFLVSPQQPLWQYCLLATLLALLPSFALSSSVYGLLTLFGINVDAWLRPRITLTLGYVFGTVVFAPVAETFILAWGLSVLSSATPRFVLVAAISGLAWGGMHALLGPLSFFGTAWSFFVFSCAYMAWRKSSFWRAYVAAAAPHALLNSSVLIYLLVSSHKSGI